MEKIGEIRSKAMINGIINTTVRENFEADDSGEELLIVKTDDKGDIKLVQADTKKINSFLSRLMIMIQKKYETVPPHEEKVYIGSLLGGRILSQGGPSVRIKIIPLTVSETKFKTELIDEGINQSKYKIYAVIKSTIKMVAPFSDTQFNVTNTILIAEAVILGQVPDNYVVVPKESILDAIE